MHHYETITYCLWVLLLLRQHLTDIGIEDDMEQIISLLDTCNDG